MLRSQDPVTRQREVSHKAKNWHRHITQQIFPAELDPWKSQLVESSLHTHEEKAATKNTCLWVKTKRDFTQGARSLWLCRLSFCSPKPNANECRLWNSKIFIYARLLSCTCLIFPFLFLLLLFLGNMQSLTGLHPGFHVRPWLLDWDTGRHWERLKSQVEVELACRAESARWRLCLLIRPDVLLMPALHYKYF